jgi:hypothetical protein
MIAASSHVLFFYLSKVYPNGYIAVGYLLFLQEQIKITTGKTRTRRTMLGLGALVVVLLVLWGARRGEAMFGTSAAGLYGVPVIGWGDFVSAAMDGVQFHPEALVRSIHRITDYKLDGSDAWFGVAYTCTMAAGTFGVYVQTRSVLREYRNMHPLERAAAKLAMRMRMLGNKNMF